MSSYGMNATQWIKKRNKKSIALLSVIYRDLNTEHDFAILCLDQCTFSSHKSSCITDDQRCTSGLTKRGEKFMTHNLHEELSLHHSSLSTHLQNFTQGTESLSMSLVTYADTVMLREKSASIKRNSNLRWPSLTHGAALLKDKADLCLMISKEM